MAVASVQPVDIEELVSPLIGDNPGGDVRAYVRELRSQFSEFRNPSISTNPDDHSASDVQPEPDWQAIRDLAIDALRTRTKDIRIACHFAEAQMHLDGLRGLASGLELISKLIKTGWDYLIPELDPEDPEVRSSPIENLLNDPDRGPCLPQAIKSLRIVGHGDQSVSFLDATRRNPSDEDKNRVGIAISTCTTEDGRYQVAQYQTVRRLLEEIQSTLDEKLESQSPSLTNLIDAVDLVGRWLINCFGAPDKQHVDENESEVIQATLNAAQQAIAEASDFSSEASAWGPSSNAEKQFRSRDQLLVQNPQQQDPASILRLSIQMRNDAYKKLTEAAVVLQQIEPHSPIPYLIHRAVRLGQMPFPDLVGKLVREESALQALRGEFGLSSEEEGS